MKTNWLWDTRLSEEQVRKILKDPQNPRFNIYAGKLFSRVDDPAVAFHFIDQNTFAHKWPVIKKRIEKDAWAKPKIDFWQILYKRLLTRFQEQGVKLRKPAGSKLFSERIAVARQIKKIRTQSGYTQKDLAEKLGVIQQYVSKVESGSENVTIDTLKRIADILDKRLVIKLS